MCRTSIKIAVGALGQWWRRQILCRFSFSRPDPIGMLCWVGAKAERCWNMSRQASLNRTHYSASSATYQVAMDREDNILPYTIRAYFFYFGLTVLCANSGSFTKRKDHHKYKRSAKTKKASLLRCPTYINQGFTYSLELTSIKCPLKTE